MKLDVNKINVEYYSSSISLFFSSTFFDNLIVGEGRFEQWMVLLEILGGAK